MSVYLSPENFQKIQEKLTVHKIKSFDSEVELELHEYKHDPNNENSSAPMFLCIHGFGEHVGMFEPFFLKLMDKKAVDCFVYNSRSHGENFITPEKIAKIEINKTSIDVLTVAEFMSEKYPNRNLYLYGNSLGGATVLYTAMKNTSRICEIPNLKGVVFENPYIQIHPNQANFLLRCIIHMFGAIIPNFVVPKELDTSGVTSDPEGRKRLESDPVFQHKATFGSARTFLKITNWVYSNLKSWPKDLPYNLHISTKDVIVDHLASKEFAYKTSGYNRNNNVFHYEGAMHALKDEVDEFKDKFCDNVVGFLN